MPGSRPGIALGMHSTNMTSLLRRASTRTAAGMALGGALFLALAACDDPAKDKAKATVADPAPAAAAAPAAKGAATYGFGNADSKIAFVGAKVTGKHDGSFDKFTGTVTLVDGEPTKSTVRVDVEAASIRTDTEKLTGHLKSADFFEVDKFPAVRFTSTTIKAGGDKGATHTVTGNLELHGVTKSITFPATIAVTPGAVNVDAEFAINRKDFGLTYPGKADDLIRDDVLVKLTIRATPNKS
jgi:polyisoprenoid-binding protein YceI